MNTTKPLLTDKQVADRLNVSVGTIRDWRYSGRGPQYIRISHRCVRYRPQDVEKWEKARIFSSTSEETETQ